MRVNQGQEFVIGGYTRGTKTFDALVFGYFKGKDLIYVARTRNGFTPATRAALFKKFKGLEIAECHCHAAARLRAHGGGTSVAHSSHTALWRRPSRDRAFR
jgi:bifunctional non-homologous end joining protein LigD